MRLHAGRRLQEAQEAYLDAIVERESPRWRYLRGVALAESGAVEASVAEFRRAVALAPDNMPAWYRLGTALLLAGDGAAAREALQQALALAPDSALLLSALADVAIAQERPDEALTLLEAAFGLEPEAGQIAYKIAAVHRRLGNSDKARTWLRRDPGNRLAPTIDDPLLLEVARLSRTPRFYRMAADWALARGDAQAAIEALGNAVTLAPSDPSLQERLASVLAEHAPDEALPAVERLLELAPDSAAGWHLLAWLLRLAPDAGARARAAEASTRSLELADLPAARQLAAALAMRDGRFATAQGHYANLAQAQPDEPRHHYWLAASRLATEDCAGIPPLQDALSLRSEWGEAHLLLARAEAICGQPSATSRAQALLRTLDNPDTRLTLAFALLAEGDAATASNIAKVELPHRDASMLLHAIRNKRMPKAPFAPKSPWWHPPEVRASP